MSEPLVVIRQTYSWWNGDDDCGTVEIKPRTAEPVAWGPDCVWSEPPVLDGE